MNTFWNTMQGVFNSLIEPFTKPETYAMILNKLIMIIIYVVVAMIIINLVNKSIDQFFKLQNRNAHGRKRSHTLSAMLKNIVRYVVWFIVLTTILGKFGISVTGLLAGAGVVGLAIGFGAQTIVKDIITGFFIIFENQFDVGDYVKINLNGAPITEGTVQSIGIRSTRIHAYTGELTVLPNSVMSEITNFSISNGKALIEVPIAMEENVDKVESKLKDFLESLHSNYFIFVSKPEILGIEDLTGNAYIMKIAAETTPNNTVPGARILRKEVANFLNQEGIKSPTPIMMQFNGQKSQ
ncbi:mechanosensitive ion channel family protein [Staphylococcus simulans]|nr:mechanosensitive ion channel protein MscS [Staphylococcus simulans]RIN78930.1 mechanosensitive ion channel family protein [Staphylococcus simulans]